MNSNFNPVGDIFSGVGTYLSDSGFLEWFMAFSSQDPITMAWQIFSHGGWIVIFVLFLWGTYQYVFLEYRSGQFASKWKFTLLAIDIPKNNEQTPKAVENLFAALAGVYSGPNLVDKYWVGKITESFSFEIVSIEGHTRFLIRTPNHFRDFIESLLYSQYPDAEINEVSDYVDYDSEEIDPKTGQPVPFRKISFPSKLYNMWGTEFVLVKSYPYPIRTYPEFEHQQTQTFLDPMANLMEILSKIGDGEQIWLQFVVQPQAPGWGEEAKKIVSKIQGKDYAPPESFDPTALISKPMEGGAAFASGIMSQAFGIEIGSGVADKKKEEDQWKMFKISPGERDVLVKVENKLSKQALKVKFRMVYLAKRPVFAKGRGVTGITGALQQFNTVDANAFKPGGYTKTAADYFFVDQRIAKRQNNLLRWFSNRTAWYGESNASSKLMLLNPEELATLWHFPVMTVKASQIEKIGSKKSAPPTRLPYMERVAPAAKKEEQHRHARTTPIQPIAPGSPFAIPDAGQLFKHQQNYEPVQPVAPVTPFGQPSQAPTMPEADFNGQLGTDEAPNKKGAPPSNLPFV